jgi:allene oxide cyclase-like protein
MRKKLSLGAVLLLLLTLAVVVVASASGDDGKEEFTVVGTTVQDSDIDLPPEEEFSQGDQFVFTEDLSQDGKVGSAGGVCTLVRLGPDESATFQCVATFSLEKGQLTIQGLVTFAEEETPAPFVLAITGGTGAFARAHGELTVKEVSETESLYTVALK